MPLYIYSCSQGHLTEARQKADVRVVECACGEVSERQSVYATSIGGRARPPVSERKVTGFKDYVEASEQIAYEHTKAEESAQQPLPQKNLWKMAKANVKKLERAGISDSLDYRPGYVK